MSGPFTCPDCGMTSCHPGDAANSYCGDCHEFKGDLRVGDHLRLRGGGMTYWQARVNLGPALFLFGVRAEDYETARDKAVDVIGDRTALLEILEVPSLAERWNLGPLPRQFPFRL